MVQSAQCDVRFPTTVDEIRSILAEAEATGQSVGLRGTGNSYGDPSLNDGGILLDLTAMNQILCYDREAGVVDVEPGVTLQEVWERVLSDGWWPPVVSGTMTTTIAGGAAMNIHGKNNFAAGTLGEHILDFELMCADGQVLTCSRDENRDVFYSAIGGFGVLGVFTRLRMDLKRVHSGLLRVEAVSVGSFEETFRWFDEHRDSSDYMVGWHDGLASGESVGRGLIHAAEGLSEGEDDDPTATMSQEGQVLPSRLLWVIPKSWLWMGLWFFLSKVGMRLVNAVKFRSGKREASRGKMLVSHAAFHFLLDYVPNWKFAYKPGGLIQYQSFIPTERAAETCRALIEKTHQHGFPPYLVVTKRHRPDPFLMTHGLDGVSMALDIRVTRSNRERVWAMTREMDEIVLAASGRFYFAKDSVLRTEIMERAWPEDAVAAFRAMKQRLDPNGLLQSDLFRRVF